VATFADAQHDVDSVCDEVDTPIADEDVEANRRVASAEL